MYYSINICYLKVYNWYLGNLVTNNGISQFHNKTALAAFAIISGPPAWITGSVAVGAWYVSATAVGAAGIASIFE